MPSHCRHDFTLDFFGLHRAWVRWLNIICFFSCLLSSDGIGPAAITWLAALDGKHGVVVSKEEDGHIHLTLTHQHAQHALAPHGPLVELLLLFSKPGEQEQMDHQLLFEALDDGRGRSRHLAAQSSCIHRASLRHETFWNPAHQDDKHFTGRYDYIISTHDQRLPATDMVMQC
jgi:hypothetical protein